MRKRAHAYFVKSPSKLLLIAATASACMSTHAENWPLSLSLTETLSRDNNLYRVEPGQYAIADTKYSTGLKLDLDKSYSRQRYMVSLDTALNRYVDSSTLNNTSYDANLGFTSEFADKGFVQLTGEATQNLASFDMGRTNSITSEKNIQSSSTAALQLQYGGSGLLNPYFRVDHLQRGFDQTSSTYQSTNQNTYSVGTFYSPVAQLSLGFGLRLTKGDTDYDDVFGNHVIDHTKRRDIDFISNWIVTGLSSLRAQLSLTRAKDTYENAYLDPYQLSSIQDSDRRGLTGSVNWHYTPQGRLAYSLGFSRDSGNSGQVNDLSNAVSLTEPGTGWQNNSNNRLTNTLTSRVDWELSSKITLNANYNYSRYRIFRSVSGTKVVNGVATPIDSSDTPEELSKSRLTEFSLGGNYVYARWLSLYCDVKRIKRTEDIEFRPYNATVTTCTGQFNINGMN